jgi:hypothetical protein
VQPNLTIFVARAFGSRYGKPAELMWAAVDSNHLPPRCHRVNDVAANSR